MSDKLDHAVGLDRWRRFKRNRRAMAGSTVMLGLILLMVSWPLVLRVADATGPRGKEFASRHHPEQLSDRQFAPPSITHWFGTDVHGRDLFSRTVYGAHVSILVGIIGAFVSLVIGLLWGAISGYAGGRVDTWMMRAVDVLYSLPSIIFVIVLITAVEGLLKDSLASASPGLAKSTRLLLLFFGLGAVSWLTMARIIRGQVLSLRQMPFVEASKALGASPATILVRHVVPHTLGIAIVYLALTIPAIILYESFLSYLGLGIQPPMSSWGVLIAEGADQMNPIRIRWWLIVFPGLFLITTLLALNCIGDGLRDAWNVRESE